MTPFTAALRRLQVLWSPSAQRDARTTTLQSGRIQVCPPEPFPSSGLSTMARELWALKPRRAKPPKPEALNKFFAVRDEFMEALQDVSQAGILRLRVERARTMRELWHLRVSVFDAVALQYSQDEAEVRLAKLNRHFPTRAPSSGFTPLS